MLVTQCDNKKCNKIVYDKECLRHIKINGIKYDLCTSCHTQLIQLINQSSLIDLSNLQEETKTNNIKEDELQNEISQQSEQQEQVEQTEETEQVEETEQTEKIEQGQITFTRLANKTKEAILKYGIDKIIEDTEKGLAYRDIASNIGIDGNILKRFLEINKIDFNHRPLLKSKFTDDEMQDMVDKYTSGRKTLMQLGDYYNTNANTIRSILVDKGITIRRRSQVNKTENNKDSEIENTEKPSG